MREAELTFKMSLVSPPNSPCWKQARFSRSKKAPPFSGLNRLHDSIIIRVRSHHSHVSILAFGEWTG